MLGEGRERRLRRGLGGPHRLGDHRGGFLPDGVDILRGYAARGKEGRKPPDRALFLISFFFLGAPVALRLALHMPVPAVGHEFNQARLFVPPNLLDDGADLLEDLPHVVSVGPDCLDIVGGGPLIYFGLGRVALHRGKLAVAVVLDNKQYRKIEDGRHIGRLVEHPLVDRAVAGDDDRDVVPPFFLDGERRAHGKQVAGPDDPVGPKDAQCRIGDVHRAALAGAQARGLSVYLGHHTVYIGPLGYHVAVPPVGGVEVVGGPQVQAYAGRHGLLPDGQVDGLRGDRARPERR